MEASSHPPRPTNDGPFADPSHRANAHTARGAALAGRGQLREAIAEFQEAVRLIPDNAIARSNLAMTMGRAGALDGDESLLAEAVEQQRMAVRVQPGNVGLYHNLAAILAIADRVDESLAVLDEALRLDPASTRTRALRSVAMLTMGDFEKGWHDFECRLETPANRASELPGIPRWRGEPMSGALLINGQAEGQGDCLQGIRFAAEARRRVGSTVLLCPPSMARLLARCQGVDRVIASMASPPAAQAQITPLYLAAALRATPATMGGDAAYLSADPDAVEKWRPAIAAMPGLKVGCAWQGNREFGPDACRSFRPDELEPLARVSGVTLVSLQKDQDAGGVAEIATRFPLVDLGSGYAAGDWMDTAAIVGGLDLVIAPDTAIAHLAGALGIPAWVALPRPADWRWGRTGDITPWYSRARLFRQDRRGDWAAVFERMADALAKSVPA